MGRKIIEEKCLTNAEVKDILIDMKNKYGEEKFDSFQEITLDYVNKFSKIESEKAIMIKKMLMKDYNFDEKSAVIMINIFPQTAEEIQAVFSKDPVISKMTKKEIQELIYKMQDLAK